MLDFSERLYDPGVMLIANVDLTKRGGDHALTNIQHPALSSIIFLPLKHLQHPVGDHESTDDVGC